MRRFGPLVLIALAACGEGPDDETGAAARDDDAPVPITAAAPDDPPFAAASAAPTPAPECASGEAVLFACPFEGDKRVSVCDIGGAAVYRFGGSEVELELTGGELARVAYSGGGEAQISFANGGYRYTLFGRTVRRGDTAASREGVSARDGLIVTRGDAFVTLKLCEGPADADFEAAAVTMPVRAELFTTQTSRADR